MKLNELKPQAGSVKKKLQVGRGIGSGKGKTCGVGQKGQKSRVFRNTFVCVIVSSKYSHVFFGLLLRNKVHYIRSSSKVQ